MPIARNPKNEIVAAISMSGYSAPFTISYNKNIATVTQYATGFYRFDFANPIQLPYLVLASGTWTLGYVPHPTTHNKNNNSFTIGSWSDFGWISAEALDILVFKL